MSCVGGAGRRGCGEETPNYFQIQFPGQRVWRQKSSVQSAKEAANHSRERRLGDLHRGGHAGAEAGWWRLQWGALGIVSVEWKDAYLYSASLLDKLLTHGRVYSRSSLWLAAFVCMSRQPFTNEASHIFWCEMQTKIRKYAFYLFLSSR